MAHMLHFTRKVHLAQSVRRCSLQIMSGAMKRLGIDRLDAEQRLSLLEEIWESLDDASLPVTDAQRAELERRVADHQQSPQDVLSLDDVRKSVLPSRGE